MRLLPGLGALILALGSGATLVACGTTAAALPAQHGAAAGAPEAHAAPAAAAPARRVHSRRPQARAATPARRAPSAGNPAGHAPVPPSARPVSTSNPTRLIGHGTPASCTSKAVVAAVRAGGVIRFNCGEKPVTIVMRATAKVRNTSAQVVLDGGGKVTLSGAGKRRILYMDTCDKRQVWTTSHCQNQATPRLTVQNLTFKNGNATGAHFDGGGGGAIFDRGGQLKVIHSTFLGNRCDATGPDLGGAAIRALSQYHNRPVYVSRSTFRGGVCSNGGALSSIGVSWTVLNSVMTNNRAVGRGANPARKGTPGGGSGGAIYNDGDTYTLRVEGTVITDNHANEGGGAIFFVSNDRTGTLRITDSRLHHNPNDGFHTSGFPGIFFLGHGRPIVVNSTIN
jgi:polymorphic membrane protein